MKFIYFLIFPLVIFSSCDKNEDQPENPINDPELEKFEGAWRFTKIHTYDAYYYVPGPQGSQLMHEHTEDTVWVSLGFIQQTGEEQVLKINFNPALNYSSLINKENGGLTCVSNCSKIADEGYFIGSSHWILDSTYYIDLGYSQLGSASSTTNSYKIKGVKL